MICLYVLFVAVLTRKVHSGVWVVRFPPTAHLVDRDAPTPEERKINL